MEELSFVGEWDGQTVALRPGSAPWVQKHKVQLVTSILGKHNACRLVVMAASGEVELARDLLSQVGSELRGLGELSEARDVESGMLTTIVTPTAPTVPEQH